MWSQSLENSGLPFTPPSDQMRGVKTFATLQGTDRTRLSGGGISLSQNPQFVLGIGSKGPALCIGDHLWFWSRRAGRLGRDGEAEEIPLFFTSIPVPACSVITTGRTVSSILARRDRFVALSFTVEGLMNMRAALLVAIICTANMDSVCILGCHLPNQNLDLVYVRVHTGREPMPGTILHTGGPSRKGSAFRDPPRKNKIVLRSSPCHRCPSLMTSSIGLLRSQRRPLPRPMRP